MGLRIKCGGDRGSAAVEFALIIPVFMLLVYGAMSFGLVFSVQHSLTQAAAEGARTAVSAPSGSYVSSAIAAAQNRVTATVGATNGKYASVTAIQEACPQTTGTCVKVTITYPYGAHPVIPKAPGLGLVLPDTINSVYEVQVS